MKLDSRFQPMSLAIAGASVRRRVSLPAVVAVLAALATLPCAAHAAASGLARADSLRLTGRTADARAAYAALAGKAPAAAALGEARCLAAVGEDAKAIDALTAAAAKHPADAALPAWLAQLEFDRGRHEAARKHVDAALALDPDQCQALFLSAELHRVAGRLEAASDGYRALVRYYNRARSGITDPEKLLWIGRAAAQFARWNRNAGEFSFLVNTIYPRARRLEPLFWPAHLEAALLFLEKYNPEDAAAELDSALAINPGAPELHAAYASIALEAGAFDSARAGLDRALAIHPRLKVAHRLRADLEMSAYGAAGAIAILEGARALDPTDEETLGRLAAAYGAVDGLADTSAKSRMGRVIAETARRNPRCGEFFATLAAALDRLRRYPDAARNYEEARRRMPQLVAVPGQLGMVWMRLGEEARAAELLEESSRIDPFNMRVRNTLGVLDLLESYGTIETEHFVIRYDPARDSLLARYAARHLEEIYPEITGRLGFRPPAKSLFEFFSSARGTSGQSWFAARMAGLPFIGTVAGCAGKIVGMVSPGDTREGFDWARVLRHEFVHVVNLQQTGFTIPHWYTEGLAVYHEDAPRPPQWEEILKRRAAAGTLFNLANINYGFMRPSAGDDWALAYCQSELYAEYMTGAYGGGALGRMLAAYADNLDTPRALEKSFGVKPEAFEAGYRKHVEQVVATAKPGAKEALQSLEAEIAAHEAAGDSAKLAAALERLVELDENEAAPRERLARLALARNDRAAAAEWAKRTIQVDVKNAEAHGILAETAAAAGRLERAVEEYETALLLGTKRQAWLMGLARACAATKRDARAREALRDLLETDPEYPGARELLGTLR